MKINNGKRKDDPFAYDDSIYKSIDLDQLDNKALLATTKRTLHNDTEQAHIEDKKNDKNATDTDPFAAMELIITKFLTQQFLNRRIIVQVVLLVAVLLIKF